MLKTYLKKKLQIFPTFDALPFMSSQELDVIASGPFRETNYNFLFKFILSLLY